MSSGFLERWRRTWGLHTLGLHLVLGYAVLFIASTALLAVAAYVLFNHFMREPDRAFMQAQAYELAAAYERGGIAALRRDLAATAADERREELLVRLADADGATVLLYNPDDWTAAEVGKLTRQQNMTRQSPSAEAAWIALGPAEDDDALEAFMLRLSGGHLLQVGMDADLREDAMASMREVFLVIALPVLILALLVGAVMAYRTLRPLRQLAETFHAVIDTGDVQMRVPRAEVRGEFADLVHLFNRMLGRIEALVVGLRDTLDNVAHDLRTPVTRLRGTAELALQEERNPDAYRDALADSLEAAESVMKVLESIMEVAEAESGTMPLHLAPLNVAELTRDVVALYRLVAEEKGLTLDARVPAALAVTADRSRMRQVLANLVDNAVKYTPPGGAVTVEAEGDAREVRLRVRDTGVGIAPHEKHRIWDRLYRGDRSRSERGLGLGLSLVKAIVEAHGGRVAVADAPGTGALFTVHLPQPPTPGPRARS